jgi:hypothetical protein
VTMRITAPVEGFTGTVANVEFVGGVGETENANAVAYFVRHGYAVEGGEAAAPKPPAKPRSAKKAAAPKPPAAE